jgi:hypothetical protein
MANHHSQKAGGAAMRPILLTLFAGWAVWGVGGGSLAAETNQRPAPLTESADWPAPTNVSRPWTRWWWLGSAVDPADLTRLLDTYHAAGLGGVEVTSIYGVQGADDRELPFLSKEWVDALRHAVREAKRNGMGVDLATGSGWRTGGPSVTEEDQNLAVVITKTSQSDGTVYSEDFKSPPKALVAYSENGEVVDLTDDASDLKVRWEFPAGQWTIYAVDEKWSRDNVKRPAPGGEGKNINPLSRPSIEHFLDYFGKALGDVPAEGIRAQFHDSYEYEGNWCSDFFEQFEQRRGYRLQDHLPALNGDGDAEEVARVKHDYRETVSDLVRDAMIGPWTEWSHKNGMITRNQSHGSPANWLDLYATCDIPEIESFGRLKGGDTNRLVFKLASSAANVAGKPLVSSESATWLEEHFNETLGEVKEIVDRLLLGGVNHIFYHGTAYSPADAAWPGWLFYASTQLNPQNPIWRDFVALNEYVTRCQSVLQATRPDNDILLYWPIHDYWQDPRGLRKDLRVHNSEGWLDRTEFGRTAKWLDEHGYAFDYISDRQIAASKVDGGKIVTAGGSKYATLIIPGAKTLPLETGRAIIRLAEAGADIISCGEAPQGTPGWKHRDEQAEFDALAARFMDQMQPHDGYSSAELGQGQIVLATDLAKTLEALKVRHETWSLVNGLQFLRRGWSGGNVYLIKNASSEPIDERIQLAAEFSTAVLMDPLSQQIGRADVDTSGAIRLQLDPGQTMLVKMYDEEPLSVDWPYREVAGEPTPIEGSWGVEFVEGGPVLPPRFNTQRLASWNEIAGPEGERFGGTARYTIRFQPDVEAPRYLLDLGQVAESARVSLNGKPVATLIGPPYRVEIGPLLAENNVLTIDVTSTAANRIRDLDRRGVKWRIFKDINLVNINYKPFDASEWPVRAAGLLGPVTLTPLTD